MVPMSQTNPAVAGIAPKCVKMSGDSLPASILTASMISLEFYGKARSARHGGNARSSGFSPGFNLPKPNQLGLYSPT